MMIPEVGSMPKVSGISNATPDGGPMPGSAPIRIPTITPTVAMNRLNGVSAIEKPIDRLARKSSGPPSDPEHADGERHPQPVAEDQVDESRSGRRHEQRERPRIAVERTQQDDEEQRRSEDHADDLEERDKGERHAKHQPEAPQPVALRQPLRSRIVRAQRAHEQHC